MNISKVNLSKDSKTSKKKDSPPQKNPSKLRFVYLLLLIILILQGSILYLMLKPIDLVNDYRVSTVINEVLGKVTTPPGEIPIVLRIGDETTLPDIKELQELSEFTKEVYKDAKNGDYVLGFKEKLVIYRRDDNLIVYDGKNPTALENESRESIRTLAQKIIDKSFEEELLDPKIENDVPSLLRVDNLKELQEDDPEFYKDAKEGDIIAQFTENRVILIYREKSEEIINSASFAINLVKESNEKNQLPEINIPEE